MTRRPDRRAYRDSPYLDDHHRSRQARVAEPSGFVALLRWFLAGFADETPEAVHAAGVWFGRPARIDAAGVPVEEIPAELVGGSQLGAPKTAEPFRQLIENSARQTADQDTSDVHYVRPMRAALDRLAGRGGDAPFMARYLAQVAYAQGDWQSVADRWFAVTPWVGRAFTEQALRRLFGTYSSVPPVHLGRPSWVDLSDSQRAAVEAGERGAV